LTRLETITKKRGVAIALSAIDLPVKCRAAMD
jgi:hypothetical protein